MRVLAGKFRCKPIRASLKSSKVHFKPTKSVVREAVFNIIMHYQMLGEVEMAGAHVLDVFCGSGAYGIEALSRGAAAAYFINNQREHLQLARYNVESLNACDDIEVQYINTDATKMHDLGQKFNIIFVDPPYKTNLGDKCLRRIVDNLQLAEQHLIFLEISAKQRFTPPAGLQIINHKVYGGTQVYVLVKKSEKKLEN